MEGGNLKGKRLANFIVKVIEDKKGRDIRLLDVQKLTTLASYFIVCTADVPEHGKAIAEEIRMRLKEKGNYLLAEEGEEFGEWIAMDYGEVIVHIMLRDKREFYNIEKIWQQVESKIKEKREA
jgi:ribosome-associated protein